MLSVSPYRPLPICTAKLPFCHSPLSLAFQACLVNCLKTSATSSWPGADNSLKNLIDSLFHGSWLWTISQVASHYYYYYFFLCILYTFLLKRRVEGSCILHRIPLGLFNSHKLFRIATAATNKQLALFVMVLKSSVMLHVMEDASLCALVLTLIGYLG